MVWTREIKGAGHARLKQCQPGRKNYAVNARQKKSFKSPLTLKKQKKEDSATNEPNRTNLGEKDTN